MKKRPSLPWTRASLPRPRRVRPIGYSDTELQHQIGIRVLTRPIALSTNPNVYRPFPFGSGGALCELYANQNRSISAGRLMSAFTQSGRSECLESSVLTGCFRPTAAIRVDCYSWVLLSELPHITLGTLLSITRSALSHLPPNLAFRFQP